jgi:hypothetical protein
MTHASLESMPGLLSRSVALIGSITVVYIIAFPYITDHIMRMPEAARITAAVVLAAPLSFAMGMPFPLGLAGTRHNDPQLMPWAWGINGCASVLSAILAILLSIEIGFTGVMLSAVLFYALAWMSQPVVKT